MNRAYLGLGSNLGDRSAAIEEAVDRLRGLPGVSQVALSHQIFETDPVGGPVGQGRYLNAAVLILTDLSPRDLLTATQAIEAGLGRDPVEQRVKNGPRTIDIDLLLYGDEIIDEPGLTVPHPRMTERDFVLMPMCNLGGHEVHPVAKRTIAELYETYSAARGDAGYCGYAERRPKLHLKVNEIFYSVQGEGTRSGLPCVFVRLRGCHLRCAYCDTTYAFHEGDAMTVDEVIVEGGKLGLDCPLWQITGGEPLLQKNVHELMTRLCDAGKTVMIETSGACDISACDPRVIRILDFKTPGSGEVDRNDWGNVEHLTERDEVKIVCCDRADYEWARAIIDEHRLVERCGAVLLSAAAAMPAGDEIAGVDGLSLTDLAEWLLADRLHGVRVQTQLHKHLWDPMARGV